MKFFWPIAFLLSCLWAGIMTYRYEELKKNPLVLNLKQSLDTDPLGDAKNLSEIEKLSFVRQFVERYVTFDAENFWQGQTALSFLMSPALREERLQEISRLKVKIQKNNTSQKGQIISVEQEADGYLVLLSIELSEHNFRNLLGAQMKIKLDLAPRTLENPWGLIISDLKFAKSDQALTPSTLPINMQVDTPSLLHFPCAVENLEIPPGMPLKVKITTFNVSEIQLYLAKSLGKEIHIKAYCHQKEFPLVVEQSPGPVLRYREISDSMGLSRAIQTKNGKKTRTKSVYQKTIEDELGFVIEE